jgi:signal peptide peptidase SppA
VQAIFFDIDSPGGEVAGNFELVEKIASRRGEKPMQAFANDHAYSAAYSIATASDSITLARSGGVGSVGVVTMHIDMSERMDKMGVKITFIYAGKHKVDGNPYQELPEAVKGRIQERIDRIYGEFVALVAENRGMDEQAVRDTEALTYDASNALDVGFADRIGSMQSAMAAYREAATEGTKMATTPKTPAAENEGGQITQAQLDSATETAKAEGVAEGASGERERINAIIGSDEGKARPKAAMSAALKTDMSVDQAKAFLADLPEEKAETPAPKEDAQDAPAPTPFAQQMDGPGVGAELEGGNGDADAGGGEDMVGQMLGNYGRMTGASFDRKAS